MNTQDLRSDQELIQKAVNGDQEAYGDLYERYLDQIYRYVYYRVQTAEEAEDLTESTFVRVWEDLRTRRNKPEIKNFRAWLYRAAHNLVIDHLRKNKPVMVELDESIENTKNKDEGIEETVLARIDSLMLAKALKKLETTARQVIVLRFLNGLSHAETAQALDLKEGHVRVIQYRALKILREQFHEQQND